MKYEPNFPVLFGELMLFMLIFFTNCSSGGSAPISEEEKAEYLKKGKEITAATFSALSSRLTQAMQDFGPAGAVEYCQLQALPITDSLSRAFNASIKRTSDKLRNPANQPTPWELDVINEYRQQLKNQEELKPKVFNVDGQVVFTAPIMVMPQCLACHGQPDQDIAPATLETLAQRYPKDRAKAYKAGELRGIWSVSLNQQ